MNKIKHNENNTQNSLSGWVHEEKSPEMKIQQLTHRYQDLFIPLPATCCQSSFVFITSPAQCHDIQCILLLDVGLRIVQTNLFALYLSDPSVAPFCYVRLSVVYGLCQFFFLVCRLFGTLSSQILTNHITLSFRSFNISLLTQAVSLPWSWTQDQRKPGLRNATADVALYWY